MKLKSNCFDHLERFKPNKSQLLHRVSKFISPTHTKTDCHPPSISEKKLFPLSQYKKSQFFYTKRGIATYQSITACKQFNPNFEKKSEAFFGGWSLQNIVKLINK